jgi:hypothetical protein
MGISYLKKNATRAIPTNAAQRKIRILFTGLPDGSSIARSFPGKSVTLRQVPVHENYERAQTRASGAGFASASIPGFAMAKRSIGPTAALHTANRARHNFACNPAVNILQQPCKTPLPLRKMRRGQTDVLGKYRNRRTNRAETRFIELRTERMSTDLIRYDLMVQDALLGVVRKILADTARDGLLGDHHFYVTFRTGLPGVRLSARMREAYPEEMTIVLQHQFWDLEVNEHGFQVGLSFKGTAELLVIPFDAITGFFDPSVQFGLKFEIQDMRPEAGANDAMPPKLAMQKNAGKSSAKTAEAARNAPRGAGAEPVIVPPREAASSASSEKAASTPKSSDKKSDGTSDAKSAEAKIVSIDAFRKKP